ncbi:PEP-CTERM system TPR-repeat protein PrsT [Aromatoleum toluolicum]|uniref:PEP-CTERM system TPR-repeat protein PrsT n=1 Tax=Aromatoleum toluolicum TaxID=90060 RepID=A0ABX1NBW7_9RHOO|nr:XrtA/PEP-CTERM system TPR-repeat protein PrsT [Aromatoleum toluolicum]NMF96798.1 PEP-CTERM system TPR-repeat protein PrsT [Aromatoleum toluolicum]
MFRPNVFPRSRRRVALALLFSGLLASCGASPDSMVGSARDYLAKNDLQAASIQLKNALQEDPKLAEARYLLGAVNLRQGNSIAAEKEFRRAIELGAPAEQVSPLLARAMVQMGQSEQVIKEFGDTKLQDPAANAQLRASVGDAYLERKDFSKARESFEAALSSNADDAPARIGLGRMKYMTGDVDGALGEAEAVLARGVGGAEEGDAHALRANVLLARKQVDDALAALNEAVKSRPESVAYHFALISLLLERGDMNTAAVRLAAMEKVAPKHPLTHYLFAMHDHRSDKAASARDHIAETIRLAPEYLPGRLLAGLIHASLNENVVAREHLAMVVGRAPQERGARLGLARLELGSGDPGKAMETLKPLLSVKTPDPESLQLAARIQLAQGKLDAASETYEKLVAVRPSDELARTQLGVARLLEGDAAAGLSDLESASALEGGSGAADFALVMVYLRQGALDKAAAAQRRLEEKRPDDPRTYMLQGGIALGRRDPVGARLSFEKALTLKSDYLPAAVNLARMDLADRKPEDALERVEAIVAKHPDNVAASLLLANLQKATGATSDKVRETLERVSRATPTEATPKLALAAEALGQRDAKKAISLAQEVIAAHPDDPRAYEMMGRAQLLAGDVQQAITAFNRQVSLQPKLPAPLIRLADAQQLAKNSAAAEQSLRRALGLKPDLIDAQRRLAALLAGTQRVKEAIAVAHTVQKQRPKTPVGWNLEGDLHLLVKDYPSAIVAYRKSFGVRSTAETVIKLHAVQIQSGKQRDAEKTVSEWLRQEPKDVRVRSYLAERAFAARRFDEAEQLYSKLDELKPDTPKVLSNLAWIAGQRRDPKAMGLAERAVRLAPEEPNVLATLGVLQVDGGQPENGIENLRKAVALAPTVPTLRLNLAKAYVKTGRKQDAAKEADVLLQSLPPSSPLRAEATALKEKL